MPKVSTVQGKLSRIQEQTELAQNEIKAVEKEIKAVEKDLTSELAKVTVDGAAVNVLEGKRNELNSAKGRLEARISALQGTIPATQEAFDRAALEETIGQHEKAITKVNNALQAWREKAKSVANLETIANEVREDRKDLAELVSKIHYLTALLGENEVNLPDAGHLGREDLLPLRESFRKSCLTELSAYSSNSWDAKLNELEDEKREEERHVRAVAAGW